MQIGKVIYPVSTLGIGTRLVIWTIGCNRICPGCSNPELQPFDKSKDIDTGLLLESIENYSFDGVTITGGEPFLQIQELKKLVKGLIDRKIEDILIFTGFTKQELENKHNEDIDFILKNISVLIDGPFDIRKPSNKILVGSTNQKVYILNSKFKEKYVDYMKKDKAVDVFRFNNEIHFIGVPEPEYSKKYDKLLRR